MSNPTLRQWAAKAVAADARAKLPKRVGDGPAFQRDAADRLLHLLETRGGAVLADDVGLGKTYVSAAVIDARRGAHQRALIIAPAAVVPHWRRVLARARLEEPAFGGVRGEVMVTSYAALVSRRHRADGLHRIPWTLIVVDEAHRLRNPATQRHRLVASMAAKASVLLVTATPFVKSRRDLVSLLRLVSRRAPSEGDLDTLRDALAEQTVRRSRALIQTLYGAVTDLGEGTVPPLEVRERRREAVRAPLVEGAESLVLAIPTLVSAAFPEPDLTDLRALLGDTLLRRLCSSPAAFVASLRRADAYLARAIEAQRTGRGLSRADFARDFLREVGGPRQGVFSFFFAAESRDAVSFASARESLAPLLRRAEGLMGREDPKLEVLAECLARSSEPSLVMTAHGATAEAVYASLLGVDRLRVGLLTGRTARVGYRRVHRDEVLSRFAPRGQQRRLPSALRLDVLVATDVLREGVNLQDAAQLIHYDQPWHPAGAAQREGRIDRLGACHERLSFVTLAPPEALAERLGDAARYARRAEDAIHCVGDEEAPFDVASFYLGVVRCAERSGESGESRADGQHGRIRGVRLSELGGWLLAVPLEDEVVLVWADGCRAHDGLGVLRSHLDVSVDTAPHVPTLVASRAAAFAAARRLARLAPAAVGARLGASGIAAVAAWQGFADDYLLGA